MSKLISVTVDEAFEMISALSETPSSLRLSLTAEEGGNTAILKKVASLRLRNLINKGCGSWVVRIHFKGIEEVQRKKSEAADKRRLDMEHSVDVLNLAEELILGLQSDLEVSVLLSRHNGGTKFIYTVYHASKNETALTFGKAISQEIMKAADREGILEKVTVFLEENEADDYDLNDEAEQDR